MNFDLARTLKKLRSLSAPARTQVAFWSAASIAGIIGVIWATTLSMRFSEAPVIAEEVRKDVAVAREEGSPLGDLMSSIGARAAAVIDAVQSVKIRFREQNPE